MKTNHVMLDPIDDYNTIVNSVKCENECIYLNYCSVVTYKFSAIKVSDFLQNQPKYITSIYIPGFKGFWVLLSCNNNSAIFLHEDLGLRIEIVNNENIYIHSNDPLSFLIDRIKFIARKRPKSLCYTYIGTDPSGLYKVGKTTDTLRRQRNIKTGNHYFNIILILDKDVENELHIKYAKKNIGGEWFSLTADDILDLIKYYGFKKI